MCHYYITLVYFFARHLGPYPASLDLLHGILRLNLKKKKHKHTLDPWYHGNWNKWLILYEIVSRYQTEILWLSN